MSRQISQYIDHTNLSPTVTTDDILKLVDEAILYEFKTVCIPPVYIEPIADKLVEADVEICTVIGFPLGYDATHTMNVAIKKAMIDGAHELDIVVPQYMVKNQQWDKVKDHMQALTDTVKKEERVVKWIIETSNLNADEKVRLSHICIEVGADFVKTSTGFGSAGANIEDILLIKKAVQDQIGIKASGGIKTRKQFDEFISAGATRIGSSSGVLIMNEI